MDSPSSVQLGVPSHCSPCSTTPLPQTAGAHVQSGWHELPQSPSAAPSHCSPASSTPFPHAGAGQVQSLRQSPVHAAASAPSQTSVA
jgi:hypothetical protein